MLDADLRELERVLRASPRDQALARRFFQALLRAGHVPPGRPGPLVEPEPAPNPGLAVGDLALVVRRARPRETFRWLPEMDERLGEVASVVRLHRDGLGAVLDVPAARPPRWEGDGAAGRSFGWASLRRLAAPPTTST